MLKQWIAALCALSAAACPACSHAAVPGSDMARHHSASTAWITYWDFDGALEEARLLGDRLSSLVFFAAYFDEENALYVPTELGRFQEETDILFGGTPPKRYVSIVNDKLAANGQASLKDTDLLWTLLRTPESASAHADELIALAWDYGFDGIEIDYEAIGNDMELWPRFLSFISLLCVRAEAHGLELRVLLEPSAPLSELAFPAGPAYVMMCYNLHGTHNGPGPKADDPFLRALARAMDSLPGKPGFALATGGFAWMDGRAARSLTQGEAEDLVRTHDASPARDPASGALYFDYSDERGLPNTVWYADGSTLRRWREVIAENDSAGTSLWRLGGNVDLDVFFD